MGKLVKFTCSLCGKDKEEKNPYFTRKELVGTNRKLFGICRPCIRITKTRTVHLDKFGRKL